MVSYTLTKHVTPAEAQAMLKGLQTWIASEATNYGADYRAAAEAAASLDDLDAFLADLASMRRITT